MAKKSLSGHDFRAPVLLGGEVGSPGQVLTSQGSGTIPTWTSPSSGGLTASQYVCVGALSADQAIQNASTDTSIAFIDHTDPQGWWNPSTKRFTPNVAGYYNITLNTLWSSLNTTSQTNVQIRKNGNTESIQQRTPDANTPYFFSTSKVIYLNGSTDYIEFTAWSPVNTQNLAQGNAAGSGTNFSATLMTAGVGPAGSDGATGPAGKFITSETAPSSPVTGDVWFNMTLGTTFIYYDSYWVEVGANSTGIVGPAGPAGADGAPGVVEATAPLTYNSITSTIGIDQTAIQPVNNNYIMYLMGAF